MQVLKLTGAILLCALAITGCNGPPPPAPQTTMAPPVLVPPSADALSTPKTSTPEANATAPGATAVDSAATNPNGNLSKQEEANSMPMAGQGNNHSSPSLATVPKK